ncbi:MAG TPA: orotidine-5'-phosphate decarboxylase [Solirubrobacteraceae bacterium]|nr:orotidine-5'-phosphate decarboxylase [Solirubrobacteraceae bacterium]
MTRLDAVTGAAGRRSFGDRVAEAVTERKSQLVLGLDPDPARLWPRPAGPPLAAGSRAAPDERAAEAVAEHCRQVLDAAAEQCVAVKLQVACFERLGAAGWRVLAEVAERAHAHGLLVIADAKRGDIDVTARAYAETFFGESSTPYGRVSSLGADALTVNPLLGADSIAPLLERARQTSGGLFVLVRTSNPGAADIQDLELRDGGTVSDRLAVLAGQLGEDGVGEAGLSDVGAVVGATVPERVKALRALMPRTIFLLPGVGAQGGSVEQLGPAFEPGPAGGLVAASRAIVAAYEQLGGAPATAARQMATRLREMIWEVAA